MRNQLQALSFTLMQHNNNKLNNFNLHNSRYKYYLSNRISNIITIACLFHFSYDLYKFMFMSELSITHTVIMQTQPNWLQSNSFQDPAVIIKDLGSFLGVSCLSDDRIAQIVQATEFNNMKVKKADSEKPLRDTFCEGYSMFRKGNN